MRKLIPALALAGALALPASASASTAHRTYCGHPDAYVTLYATGVSCKTALTVERYGDRHNTLLYPTAQIAGRRWAFLVDRRAHGHEWVGNSWVPIWLTRAISNQATVATYTPPYG